MRSDIALIVGSVHRGVTFFFSFQMSMMIFTIIRSPYLLSPSVQVDCPIRGPDFSDLSEHVSVRAYLIDALLSI